MKIVILDSHTENPGDLSWAQFEKFGDLTIYDRTSYVESDLIRERIGDAGIVITNKTPITPKTMDTCKGIKLICVIATGYNVVDIGYAKEKGIPVVNVPAYGTDAVAQHTIAMLLEMTNLVGMHDRAVHGVEWENSIDFCFWKSPLMELSGKTMGVIGFGRIGRAVGKIAAALGMRVLAFNPSRCEEGEKIGEYVDLDTLFAEADVISLNCPLTDSNQFLVRRETIAKMKDGVLLLNTARGGLICEEDLAEALRSGKVAGAAVDVVSAEPVKSDNPLLKAPNCILTPHIAWAPIEARQRIMDITEKNITCFLEGNPQNVVNS